MNLTNLLQSLYLNQYQTKGKQMNFTKIRSGMYESADCWITDVWYMHEGDPDAIAQLSKNGWAYGAHGEIWGVVKTLKEAKEICSNSIDTQN